MTRPKFTTRRLRRQCLRALTAAAACPLLGCLPGAPSLRVACDDWAPYLFAEVERAAGRLDPGVVRLVEMPSSGDSLQALHARSVEAAGLTLDQMLLARSRGLDLVAVAVCNESHGADMLLAAPRIGSLGALRGRRIGLERTATGAVLLKGALDAAGLQPHEVELVDLPLSRHRAALASGAVDAVVTFGAGARALRAGGARVLFDSARMPGAIVDVIAVRADACVTHEAALRTLLAAHFTAQRAWRQDPSVARPALARRLGVAVSEVDALFEGLTVVPLEAQHEWLRARLASSARALQTVMLDGNLLERPAALRGLSDERFLPPKAEVGA